MMVSGAGWQQSVMAPPLPTAPTSVAGSSNASSVPTKTPVMPQMQKRRRVTRACDECRRKKIKCDGKQPCSHCTIYSYECTYDQPSNRRRNPPPMYTEHLEQQVQALKTLLKSVAPDLDVDSPDFDPAKLPAAAQAVLTRTQVARPNGQSASSAQRSGAPAGKDTLLDVMVESTGKLDIDQASHVVEYHGQSSGMAFLGRLNGSAFGGKLSEVRLEKTPVSRTTTQDQSPQSRSSASPQDNLPDITLFPVKKEKAIELVETCLDKACVLMRFVHKPTFMAMTDRLYKLRPEDYEDDENTFLPLFYLALAVGCLFLEGDENYNKESSMKFFTAGRRMIEMTDIRDIFSLQAVLFMTIYLQSSTRMSTCYSYVGIALSAAVRMGMHRSIPDAMFDPIEREVRKRIFWTCWKMDTYVGAILGLPKGIAPEDIDQEMPQAVDDGNITKEGIKPMPEGQVSTMAAANAHTRLLRIMAKTVVYIYPLKGVEASVTGNNNGYGVSYTKLKEIEGDLQQWLDELPPILKPGKDTPRYFLKCQFLLKMSFAHVQMMLYRPFVHYIVQAKHCGDERYAIASACVNVARKIVHTSEEMRKNGLLNGAYWFTIYTTFFSIITLIYYVTVNPPDSTSQAVLEDAKVGIECLSSISGTSPASKRCTTVLNPIFKEAAEKFNGNFEKIAAPRKKRARAGSNAEGDDGEYSPTLNGHSTPDYGTQPPETLARQSKTLSYLSNGSLSDQNGMCPSQDLFNFVPHNMGPAMQQQQQFVKSEAASQLNSPIYPSVTATMSPSDSFSALEGNPLGPVPPYLLQNHQAMIEDMGMGSGSQMQGQQIDNGSIDQPMPNQFFMTNSGGDGSVPNFWRDEWGDILLPTNYRSA